MAILTLPFCRVETETQRLYLWRMVEATACCRLPRLAGYESIADLRVAQATWLGGPAADRDRMLERMYVVSAVACSHEPQMTARFLPCLIVAVC